MNYPRFFNRLSLNRAPSPLRVLTGIIAQSPPDTISLAVGLPNPDMFPFEEATVKLKDGSKINISGSRMKKGLQYAESPGIADLREWLLELQKKLHSPKIPFDVIVTPGSQDGLCKSAEMMLNMNDYLLLEEPAYPGALGIFNAYRPQYLPLDGDSDGIKPESLLQALQPWKDCDVNSSTDDMPKILYTVPNGNNPSGTSLTEKRKWEIYEIAQRYNLIILEDDPYYFLSFAKERIPSFLSMDTDGRVIRFDSFAKILSAGLRIGFSTGPAELLHKIMLHMQVSVLHANSMAQVLVSELLHKWGVDGFLEHTERVRDFYMSQQRHMQAAAERHLKGLATWDTPTAGMFMWIRVLGVGDTSAMLKRAMDKKVILAPGNAFMTDSTKPCQYLRASYSIASPEDMEQGFQRLSALIREEQQLQK